MKFSVKLFSTILYLPTVYIQSKWQEATALTFQSSMLPSRRQRDVISFTPPRSSYRQSKCRGIWERQQQQYIRHIGVSAINDYRYLRKYKTWPAPRLTSESTSLLLFSRKNNDQKYDQTATLPGAASLDASTSSGEKSSSSYHERERSKHGSSYRKKHPTSKIRKNGKNSSISSKKFKVRSMFRQAKDMERSGQWRKAQILLGDILKIDPYDSYSHLALARLQSRRERTTAFTKNVDNNTNSKFGNEINVDADAEAVASWEMLQNTMGVNRTNNKNSNNVNDSTNGRSLSNCREIISETDLIMTQNQQFSHARQAFYTGTQYCPESIHLWQAWALHEQSIGNLDHARFLFKKALELDSHNPYVCHAFGLLEQRSGNIELAKELWKRPLESEEDGSCSAALVCSLGELYVTKGYYHEARDLYMTHVSRLSSEREVSEVYLTAAWLEENHFKNIDRAEELLNLTLSVSPGNSRAQVALAKLEGRRVEYENTLRLKEENNNFMTVKKSNSKISVDLEEDGLGIKNAAIRKNLEEACMKLAREKKQKKRSDENGDIETSDVRDGRLFNAWANLEVQGKKFNTARRILKKGAEVFPRDHSLLQAAGKVEERVGNFTGAKDLYRASLLIEPSAPTLLAYAMLEMRHPETESCNFTKVTRLFEEALLLDPRHGPVYNAYGNMELRKGNVERARQIFQSGVYAHCTDVASVYHGLAKLELSLGNVETARMVLVKGLKEVELQDGRMDSNKRNRAVFLAHTLGMLELNSNRAAEAKNVFEKGIQRYRDSSQLLLGAALCEVKLGNEDAARQFFEKAIKADRKHAQAWQSWGVMEMRAGNYKVAKTLFECGIRSDSSHGALWQAYATMESHRGNFETARAVFAAGVIKCPNHIPLYQAWACLEMRGDNFTKAKTLIGEALTRDKSQGTGWLVAAKVEEKQGNDGLVALILRRGLECAPNHAPLYCALAELEIRRGKIQVARELLEKGLEVDPLHAPLYHSLAELEARVFNIDGLAKLNKRAAEVFTSNALVPPPTSMEILGNKLRKMSGTLPKGVAALAQMVSIEMDLDESVSEMDPDTIIKSMSQFEDNVVGDIFREND